MAFIESLLVSNAKLAVNVFEAFRQSGLGTPQQLATLDGYNKKRKLDGAAIAAEVNIGDTVNADAEMVAVPGVDASEKVCVPVPG